jgi:hypothetical protein
MTEFDEKDKKFFVDSFLNKKVMEPVYLIFSLGGTG